MKKKTQTDALEGGCPKEEMENLGEEVLFKVRKGSATIGATTRYGEEDLVEKRSTEVVDKVWHEST